MTLPVTVARTQPLIREAWGYRHNLIVHDAVYVVLAHHLDAPLLTGDRRIAGAPNLPITGLHHPREDLTPPPRQRERKGRVRLNATLEPLPKPRLAGPHR